MATVRLQATMGYPYAGRSLAIGDQFDAPEPDAHLLKTIGQAIDAPRARGLKTRDLDPEPDTTDTPDAIPAAVKRRYRRRDLTAER